MPWHPSIAQVRSGQCRTARSIARYPDSWVPYPPRPGTVSSPAITSIVADRLCRSIPMTALLIATLRPRLLMTFRAREGTATLSRANPS